MLLSAIHQSINLLIGFDKELYSIIFITLKISIAAIIIAICISIPLAISIDLMKSKFKRVIIAILNSLLAIPTVVIGLFVYMTISNSGPFGTYNLLYTPWAIVIGQTILAIPIVTTMVLAGLTRTDKILHETLITLGAGRLEIIKALFWENKPLILAAVLAGFGRVVAEIGISMMLGGNIRWYTRTITTAIALETGKGDFALAIALGFILIFFAVIINLSVYLTCKKDYILKEV